MNDQEVKTNDEETRVKTEQNINVNTNDQECEVNDEKARVNRESNGDNQDESYKDDIAMDIGFEDLDKYNGEFLEDEMTNILDLI